MQQRQLRLGDIVDDYCPRERRITNHAVVAMVGDDVKQTRCTTCDADHPYKRAQVPAARRKKEAVSAAYRAVLASVQQEAAGAAVVARVAEPETEPTGAIPTDVPAPGVADHQVQPPAAGPAADRAPAMSQPGPALEPQQPAAAPPVPARAPAAGSDDATHEGRVHRRLIRAQLPRVEGKEPTPRPIPQFTIHDARAAAAFRGRGGPRTGNSGRQGSRGPFTRDAGGRGSGGFPARTPKAGDHGRRARHGGHPHKNGKKHSR